MPIFPCVDLLHVHVAAEFRCQRPRFSRFATLCMRARPQRGQIHLRFLWKERFNSLILTLQRWQVMLQSAPAISSG